MIPHFMKGVWQGPATSFWKDHTIEAQTVHRNNSYIGDKGAFKCANNNPILCALDLGLAFIADMNVSNSV